MPYRENSGSRGGCISNNPFNVAVKGVPVAGAVELEGALGEHGDQSSLVRLD